MRKGKELLFSFSHSSFPFVSFFLLPVSLFSFPFFVLCITLLFLRAGSLSYLFLSAYFSTLFSLFFV